MKQLLVLVVIGCCLSSCGWSNPDLDISMKDADHYFVMNADFEKHKTRRIENFMDQEIGKANNISFVNTSSNAMFTLADRTKFYLEKEPGHIRIRVNKNENSRTGYYRIRNLCGDIKELIMQ